MNIEKSLVAGITCVSFGAVGTAGYLLFNHYTKPIFRINPSGKSLRTKYPNAKIPEQPNTLNSDNSF